MLKYWDALMGVNPAATICYAIFAILTLVAAAGFLVLTILELVGKKRNWSCVETLSFIKYIVLACELLFVLFELSCGNAACKSLIGHLQSLGA